MSGAVPPAFMAWAGKSYLWLHRYSLSANTAPCLPYSLQVLVALSSLILILAKKENLTVSYDAATRDRET